MRFDFGTWAFVERGHSDDYPSVVTPQTRLNWADLDRQSKQMATTLVAAGADVRRPVVIIGHKEPSFVVAITACIRASIPYIPIDTIVPQERIARIVELTAPAAIVACSGEPGQWPAGPALIDGQGKLITAATLTQRQLPALLPERLHDPIVYIIFTSGSTGQPKGVQITREAIQDFVAWLRSDFGFLEGETFLNQAPFSFDLSVYEVMGFLACGGTMLLASAELQKDPVNFGSFLAENGCTTWVSTPSFAKVALQRGQLNGERLPSLRQFLFCGEVLPNKLAQDLLASFPRAKVLNTYGPTEATVATTLVNVTAEVIARYNPLPVGFVKPRSTIEIVGDQGEIVLGGNNVALGYLNDPKLNEQKFRERAGGGRLFFTGDSGFFKDDMLFFLGRQDHQIKLNGYRIELGDIDCSLEGLAGVEMARTLPLKAGEDIRRLVAFVKHKGGSRGRDPAVEATLKAGLSGKVPVYMVPSEIVFVADFPHNANHKVDGKELLRRYLENAL